MATIDIALTVKIDGTTTVDASPASIEAEAFSTIKIELKPEEERKVEVQPSKEEQVSFILITSNRYSTEEGKITYKIEGGDKEISLEQPHIYVKGMVMFAELENPNQPFVFKNTYKKVEETTPEKKENPVATIEILVGRNVTPQE